MSGETKYTPGPWHVGLVDETSVLSADRETVALCCDRYEDDPERKAADARLIAAAPCMLEALTLAEAVLSNAPEFETTAGGRIPLTKVSEARDVARAALSKAGGPNVG